MSEMYDMAKLWEWCRAVVVLVDVAASSLWRGFDPVEFVVGVLRAKPNTLENPIGSMMACAPVATADIANMMLTVLKMGRREVMIGWYR